jgi:hypothetical protein
MFMIMISKDIIASPITIADEIRPQGNLISSLNVVQIRSREPLLDLDP